MIRKLAFLVLAQALCHGAAQAGLIPGTFNEPIHTYVAANSSYTVTSVSVSTSVITQVDTPQLAGRVSLEIQNTDGTANLWCGNSAVTTTTGRKLTTGTNWLLPFADKSIMGGTLKLYCISDGAATTKAIVTQFY